MSADLIRLPPAPRLGCAYFGNRRPAHFRRDLAEIAAAGFDTVVHCVTEADVRWERRAVERMLGDTRAAGLSCWADPWGVAGAFEGEALHSGRPASRVVPEWLAVVAGAGAEWVFWDEPRDLAPLPGWVGMADALGMRSSVCLAAIVTGLDPGPFRRVAAIPGVADIGTDPYDLGQRAYTAAYPDRAAALVRGVADDHAVGAHLWVQGFGLTDVRAQVAACRRHRLDGLFFWGFRGCEVQDFAAPASWDEVRREVAGG